MALCYYYRITIRTTFTYNLNVWKKHYRSLLSLQRNSATPVMNLSHVPTYYTVNETHADLTSLHHVNGKIGNMINDFKA